MLLHVLGVGSIGSLVATQLQRHSANAVRLIVRKREYFDALSSTRDITIERSGIQSHYSGYETELLPHPANFSLDRQPPSPRYNVERKLQQEVEADRARASYGPIESLVVTTKADAVLPAIQLLATRLSKDSTIVLLQNGAGLLESLVQNMFPDEKLRPSFVVAVNSHGAWVKDWGNRKNKPMHTVWAGVGELNFGVLPNYHVRKAVKESAEAASGLSASGRGANPLLFPMSSVTPDLAHLPYISPTTSSLHTTISSLLSCQALNPKWLSLPTLLTTQLQKVAINSIINPLTAIYDIQNGVLNSNKQAERIAYRVADEASQVFAEQLRRNLQRDGMRTELHTAEGGESYEESSNRYLLEHKQFPEGHPLNADSILAKAMSVAKGTSRNVSSTLQDIRAGKQATEIDYMSGYITRLGIEYGIPTPVNDTLADMVRFKVDIARMASRTHKETASREERHKSQNRKITTERFGQTYLPRGLKGTPEPRDTESSASESDALQIEVVQAEQERSTA